MRRPKWLASFLCRTVAASLALISIPAADARVAAECDSIVDAGLKTVCTWLSTTKNKANDISDEVVVTGEGTLGSVTKATRGTVNAMETTVNDTGGAMQPIIDHLTSTTSAMDSFFSSASRQVSFQVEFQADRFEPSLGRAGAAPRVRTRGRSC